MPAPAPPPAAEELLTWPAVVEGFPSTPAGPSYCLPAGWAGQVLLPPRAAGARAAPVSRLWGPEAVGLTSYTLPESGKMPKALPRLEV